MWGFGALKYSSNLWNNLVRHDESAECSITPNRTKKITRTSPEKRKRDKKKLLFIELIIEL